MAERERIDLDAIERTYGCTRVIALVAWASFSPLGVARSATGAAFVFVLHLAVEVVEVVECFR